MLDGPRGFRGYRPHKLERRNLKSILEILRASSREPDNRSYGSFIICLFISGRKSQVRPTVEIRFMCFFQTKASLKKLTLRIAFTTLRTLAKVGRATQFSATWIYFTIHVIHGQQGVISVDHSFVDLEAEVYL